MTSRCRRKKKRIFKCVVVVILSTAIISLAAWVCRRNVIEYVSGYAEEYVKSNIIDSLNECTTLAVKEDLYSTYANFVEIHKDAEGKVTLITANMLNVNLLMRDLAYISQDQLKKYCADLSVSMPLGVITGSQLLASYGPKIDVAAQPIGSVQCNFRSEFKAAGINQVKHSLIVDLNAKVRLALPLYSDDVEAATSVVLFENIIVGEVPEFYLNGGFPDLLSDLQS